jgi:hypothetical protein
MSFVAARILLLLVLSLVGGGTIDGSGIELRSPPHG